MVYSLFFLNLKYYKKNKSSSSSSFIVSSESFRFIVISLFLLLGFFVVVLKLYFLQVVQGEELQKRAYNMRNVSVSIDAKRGGIFMQDVKVGTSSLVALNTTLYTIFVDARNGIDKNGYPFGIKNESFPLLAKELTDILYTRKYYLSCKENIKKCPKGSVTIIKQENGEDIYIDKIPTYEEAKMFFQKNLEDEFSKKREKIIWATDVEENILRQIEQQSIPNLYVSIDESLVYVDLNNLTNVNREKIAKIFVHFFGGKKEKIIDKLYSKKRGYIPVMDRVYPESIKKIEDLQAHYYDLYLQKLTKYNRLVDSGAKDIPFPDPSPFESVGFKAVPTRYYPENDLAAQVIGFVDASGEGKYGIEKSLNTFLKGEDGVVFSSRDARGNDISVSEQKSDSVKDGADIILTLDRSLQKKVEEILDKRVEEFEADSAQAIVINPHTGEILAMAQSPRFNLNFYGDVYARKKVEKNDLETIYKTTPLEKMDKDKKFFKVDFDIFTQSLKRGAYNDYYIFKNKYGPSVYVNKFLMEIYEPGSVIKPLIMAAALEEGEITEHTLYNDAKPIKVGPFTIENSDKTYPGMQTMSNIMERSANIGMVFISRRMGKPLMYEAFKNFKFGEYTNILLPDELTGNIKYYKKWSNALLFTSGYGQGISATPLQVVRAWVTLANGGYIVDPRIVREVRFSNGKVEKTIIKKKKIFSTETISIMNRILINAVQKGVAKRAKVKGYYVAGKTGTSQIINTKGSGYESIKGDEKGTTITSFIGYAPVKNPEYLVYVKFDRPRKGIKNLDVYGSTTAAPTFSEIFTFIFKYFSIPKDKS